jgi:hypothetical protein
MIAEWNLVGPHQEIWTGNAAAVRQTTTTITFNSAPLINEVFEITVDRATHLPLAVRALTQGLEFEDFGYEYMAIEIIDDLPEDVAAVSLPQTTGRANMTFAEASAFNDFPAYYVGRSFSGLSLSSILHVEQTLTTSPPVNVLGISYRPTGLESGPTPVYLTVSPKTPEVLADLAFRNQQGLVGKHGDTSVVATGHFLKLAILDDAVVWLYGPDEPTVDAMLQGLHRLNSKTGS